MDNAANGMPAPATAPAASAGVSKDNSSFYALTLGSVGVVYGDIGTSPLYAFREAVMAAGETGPRTRAIRPWGLLLDLWALNAVVTCKNVAIPLRAENKRGGRTLHANPPAK